MPTKSERSALHRAHETALTRMLEAKGKLRAIKLDPTKDHTDVRRAEIAYSDAKATERATFEALRTK